MMGGRADVVLSDMAANTTGHRKTDQLRILGLVEGAAAFAAEVLNPGGTFVAKVFQSGADAALMTQLKHDFASVKHVKPASSRKDSSERYVLAMGFRGHPLGRKEHRLWMLRALAQPLIAGGDGLAGGLFLGFGSRVGSGDHDDAVVPIPDDRHRPASGRRSTPKSSR